MATRKELIMQAFFTIGEAFCDMLEGKGVSCECTKTQMPLPESTSPAPAAKTEEKKPAKKAAKPVEAIPEETTPEVEVKSEAELRDSCKATVTAMLQAKRSADIKAIYTKLGIPSVSGAPADKLAALEAALTEATI